LPSDKIRVQISFAQASTIPVFIGAEHNNFKFLSSARLTKLQNRGEIHWTSRRMVVPEVVKKGKIPKTLQAGNLETLKSRMFLTQVLKE